MTIYENLKKDCGIDSTGTATKNKQLHNMFVEVLHVTAMNYAMFNLSFKTYDEGGQSAISNASVSLKDKGFLAIKYLERYPPAPPVEEISCK
jgi:hypothetical protein